MMAELKRNLWIRSGYHLILNISNISFTLNSPGTRVVFIDFTGKFFIISLQYRYKIIIISVYNPNLNHWCVVRQTFELPASGGVVPNNFYTITKLIRSQLTLNDELFELKHPLCSDTPQLRTMWLWALNLCSFSSVCFTLSRKSSRSPH